MRDSVLLSLDRKCKAQNIKTCNGMYWNYLIRIFKQYRKQSFTSCLWINWYIIYSSRHVKSTLMQIWKSLYIFMFENLVFLILHGMHPPPPFNGSVVFPVDLFWSNLHLMFPPIPFSWNSQLWGFFLIHPGNWNIFWDGFKVFCVLLMRDKSSQVIKIFSFSFIFQV